MLTIAEAAERVGRTPGTVRRWIREGRLPVVMERDECLTDPGDLDVARASGGAAILVDRGRPASHR
jgi:excisionase family DNA binding protein